MKHIHRQLFCAVLALLVISDVALAQRRGGGGRGGGGFRGGGGGGGFRGGGGGFARASARPSVTSRPSMPSRPAISAPSVSRPNISAPSVGSRPNITPPNAGSRPNITPPSGANRPNISGGEVGNRPNITPPGGGANRPANRPGDRPININNKPINIRDNDVIAGGGSRWDPDYGCCHPIARGAAWGAAAAVTAAAIGSSVYALPSNCVVTVVNGITYEQCGSAWYQPQFVGDDTAYIVVAPPQ